MATARRTVSAATKKTTAKAASATTAKKAAAKKAPAKKAAAKAAKSTAATTTAATATTAKKAPVKAAKSTAAARATAAKAQGRRYAPAAELAGEELVDPRLAADAETGDAEPAGDEKLLTAEIEFRGRPMVVQMLRPEQMVVMKRLAEKWKGLADPAAPRIAMDQALKMTERAIQVVTAVLVNPDDRDWVEGQMVEGVFGLTEASQIIRDGMAAIKAKAEATGNRQQRRDTAKKAARTR